eukprot:2993583-Pyramimonas_sp.AAC.1
MGSTNVALLCFPGRGAPPRAGRNICANSACRHSARSKTGVQCMPEKDNSILTNVFLFQPALALAQEGESRCIRGPGA